MDDLTAGDARAVAPEVSIVIPTYQRRELVQAAVRALSRQTFDGPFEVIVVVDGSTDGTERALRASDVSVPLRILTQENSGQAAARNRGAASARGRIVLFLDDDMEAAPDLVVEHLRAHESGAHAVVGAIPLHPDAPSNLIADGIRGWADEFAARAAAHDAVPFCDMIGGHVSVRRDVFEALGGFDETFNRAGSYGAEDVEFGYRLISAGYRAVFNPRAVCWQRYNVDAATHLRQVRQAGRADVRIVRKHPELATATFAEGRAKSSRIYRRLRRPVLGAPRLAGAVVALLRDAVARRVAAGRRDRLTNRLFFTLRAIEYWRGVADAGGVPGDHPVRVLNYHAIADLHGDAIMEDYGVPPDDFRAQIESLLHAGYQFLEPDEFLRFLKRRGGVPRKALLLTFDDGYEDLAHAAAPVLESRGIAALAFAVSQRLGGTNDWDRAIGAHQLRLLDAAGLARVARRGIEIGAHSRTHRPLDAVAADELVAEIGGSAEDLRRCGLGPVRFFAYPHGAYDARVTEAARQSGLEAAFTVDPGTVKTGDDPFTLRRVEILRRHRGWQFRLTVLLAGRRAALRARIRHRLRRARDAYASRGASPIREASAGKA